MYERFFYTHPVVLYLIQQ